MYSSVHERLHIRHRLHFQPPNTNSTRSRVLAEEDWENRSAVWRLSTECRCRWCGKWRRRHTFGVRCMGNRYRSRCFCRRPSDCWQIHIWHSSCVGALCCQVDVTSIIGCKILGYIILSFFEFQLYIVVCGVGTGRVQVQLYPWRFAEPRNTSNSQYLQSAALSSNIINRFIQCAIGPLRNH